MAGELSYTQIKTLIDAYIKVNGNREITPPLHNLIETALANSNLNKKDGGILEALAFYVSAIPITDPLTLVYKSWVEANFTAIANAIIQGSNALTEPLIFNDDTVSFEELASYLSELTLTERTNLAYKGYVDDLISKKSERALLYYGQSMLEVGNSLMYGQDGSSAYKDFAQIVTDQLGLIETNQGVSGAGIFRMVKEAYTNLSATGSKSVLMANPDINGIRAAGDNPKTYTKVQEGIKALMLRANLKTAFAASDGSVTQGGTWTTVTGSSIGDNAGLSLGGNALKSIVSGSTLTFTVNGQNVVIGTFCTDGVSEVSGPFTVTIDGTVMGTWDGDGLADGVSDNDGYNNRITQGVIWFDNLAETNHTVVITTTSTDAVRIDYVGTYNYKNDRRPLIICETTKCTAAGYAISPANATDEIVDNLNAAMLETVNQYSDEFPIYLAKLDEGFDPDTMTTDGLHYNDIGHAHAAEKILEKVTSVKYLLGKLGVGGTPFAKVDVVTETDEDIGNVLAWGNMHFRVGFGGATGMGLGISIRDSDNTAHIMAISPATFFMGLEYTGLYHSFFIGNDEKVVIDLDGDLLLNENQYFIKSGNEASPKDTAGNWRQRIDGDDFVIEKYESGSWTEKQRIS